MYLRDADSGHWRHVIREAHMLQILHGVPPARVLSEGIEEVQGMMTCLGSPS